MADDDKPNIVNEWIKAIRAVAASMNCSEREAAEWLMFQFRLEARRVEEQQPFGSTPDSYDPNLDEDHPKFGFRRDDSDRS